VCFLLWWEKLDENKEEISWQSDMISTLYSRREAWHRKEVDDNCPAGPNGCLGITILETHKGADIFLKSDDTDIFRRLVEHEVGHVLGLGHSCDARDLMYSTIGKGSVRKNLTDNDKSMALCLFFFNRIMNWDEICSPSRFKEKYNGC